tara:strand:+ start:1956 stop:2135 length:180 start_codon:yes stop_codon:yes gene_type:complete
MHKDIKSDQIKRYVLELENIIRDKLSDEVIIESKELRTYYLFRQKELIDLIKDFLKINN